VGVIDAAALGPVQEIGPRPRTRKRQKIFSILVIMISVVGTWYNFGKIIKIVATIFHILKLKCTKFDFGYLFS